MGEGGGRQARDRGRGCFLDDSKFFFARGVNFSNSGMVSIKSMSHT